MHVDILCFLALRLTFHTRESLPQVIDEELIIENGPRWIVRVVIRVFVIMLYVSVFDPDELTAGGIDKKQGNTDLVLGDQ